MKKILYTIAVALCMLTSCNDDDLSNTNIIHEFLGNGEQREMYPHPCLLLERGGEDDIRSIMAKNQAFFNIGMKVYAQADNALKLGPSKFKLEGTAPARMLTVSRQSLQNLFSLSMAWRLSGQEKYLDGAVAELNSVCAFESWNPNHFLDVGEMAMGVAIAYDWLYYLLPDETKALAENALEHLAIDEALKIEGAYTSGGNWNSVCQAGCVYASLAIYDRCPEKSRAILDKCNKTNPNVLASYLPDGNYPEGYMYWSYGTGFQCMLFYGLEHLGLDVPVAKGHTHTDFFNTAHYYLHNVGTSGIPFNYSDCGEAKTSFDPTMFYFAGRTMEPSLLYWETKNALDGIAAHRLLPAALIFSRNLQDVNFNILPQSTTYYGRGITPVYIARSSWDDPDAAFLGIKGGRPSSSHSHNDAATFVYDVNGLRWACDLGNEPYEKIENAGLSLWDMNQSSDRWKLTRYNNSNHNTVTINGMQHNVNGETSIVNTFDVAGQRGAIVDYSQAFESALLERAVRTVTLDNEKRLTVSDKFTQIKKPITLEWHFITKAVPEIKDNKIILTQSSRVVEVSVVSSVSTQAFANACTKAYNVEASLDGYYRVGFKTNANVNVDEATITVQFTPIK